MEDKGEEKVKSHGKMVKRKQKEKEGERGKWR